MTLPERLSRQLGLSISSETQSRLCARFVEEMQRGLAGEPSSLQMIPSYYSTDNPVLNEPAVVIDAGGTRLRCAKMENTPAGRLHLTDKREIPLPGATSAVSSDEFFSRLTALIRPICSEGIRVGFCFSYPMRQLPTHDAVVVGLTKEIKISGIIGQQIGETLRSAMESTRMPIGSVSVLNDTVATLLAGVQENPLRSGQSRIGLIVGTGTNMAYVENNQAIPSTDMDSGTQIINCEAGGFARVQAGPLDRWLDENSVDPGNQLLEKMVSGRYLGSLIWRAIQLLEEKDLWPSSLSVLAEQEKPFTIEEFSKWLSDPSDTSNRLVESLQTKPVSPRDLQLLTSLVHAVIDRSASLAAVGCAAAITKRPPDNGALISYDGSLAEQFPGYLRRFTSWLNRLLPADTTGKIAVRHPEMASLYGAGIAALTN